MIPRPPRSTLFPYTTLFRSDGIPKPVLSGGEEDLANLVLRLAISQMIAERAGQNFSLLILDEVFGSLDEARDRKSTRLNSSHQIISYAVFCLKKKKKTRPLQ